MNTHNLILSVKEVLHLEKLIAESGISYEELMKRAGTSVSDRIRLYSSKPSTVTILCGTGNNGGDGWVVAQNLLDEGYHVNLVTATSPEEISTYPATCIIKSVIDKKFERLSILIKPSSETLKHLCDSSSVLVDALLGTGFSYTEVREPYASWIRTINSYHKTKHIVSIDVPSGLSAQTGTAADTCVHAHTTITIIAYKKGLLTEQAKKYCGEISLAPLVDISSYREKLKES